MIIFSGRKVTEYIMKRTLVILLTAVIALSGCSKTKNEQAKESPSPSPTFEEVQKIEMEVKDYEAPSATPAQATVPAASPDSQTSGSPSASPGNTSAASAAPSSEKPAGNSDSSANTANDTSGNNTSAAAQPETVDLTGKIICIDPGHGSFTESKTEKIAPNSSTKKAAYKAGTKGRNSVEDTVNLAVGQLLKDKLTALGATVIMTRTDENSTMSNIERAQFANTNKADISVKLHADGTQEGGSGMTMLVPGSGYIKDKQMLADSKRLGKAILKNAVAQTGARNRGTYTNSGMTGFNWSEVPVVLFEMGFMTNRKDEEKLNNPEYQNKIAEGIKLGIIEYFK